MSSVPDESAPAGAAVHGGSVATAPRPMRVRVTWAGEHVFDAGRVGAPTVRLDSAAKAGPSPVDALLSALAACTMVDVVDILAKRRTTARALAVDVEARRVATVPKRLEHVTLTYAVDGDGIDRVHAERAVMLAVTKYCSVRDSLAPDVTIAYAVTINGEPGEPATAAPAARFAVATAAGADVESPRAVSPDPVLEQPL